MSLQEKANQILAIKNNIKTAITNKGVDMTSAVFEDYPDKITAIPAGGSQFVEEKLSSHYFDLTQYEESDNYHIFGTYNLKKACKIQMIPGASGTLTGGSPQILKAQLNYDGTSSFSNETSGYIKDGTILPKEGGWLCNLSIANNVLTVSFRNQLYTSGYNTHGVYLATLIFSDDLQSDSDYIWCDGWNCACLLKGTLITLANGSQKKVQDITYLDELLVWNFDEGKLDTAQPIWIKRPQKANYYFHTKYANGTELYTTGESSTGWAHRAFDMRLNKFRYVYESIGNDVKTIDGSTKCIASEYVDCECEFYNIITQKHYNLFANNILTSCSLNNLYPIKDMKFIKDNRKLLECSFEDIPNYLIEGLRLREQTEDKTEYVKNLMSLDVKNTWDIVLNNLN